MRGATVLRDSRAATGELSHARGDAMRVPVAPAEKFSARNANTRLTAA
jgi:hypothetical protein